MKNHITKDQFILEFFGPLGRELGDPKQFYTDSPIDIFPFIEACTRDKKPAFISVQPRFRHHSKIQFGIYGIEKLFYDFDYGIKSDKFTDKQIEKLREKMKQELKTFLYYITKEGIIPLVVKTRKGYHIYIYFDKVYQIDSNEDFWKNVYKALHERFTKSNGHKYKFIDTTSEEDISRLCRIPTSIHQISGEECIILDANLKPTKLRSIEYFKMYGLRHVDIMRAVNWVIMNEEQLKKEIAERRIESDDNWKETHGFTGEIRPCFKTRMNVGEMSHPQRRALCIEAFYAGYNTPEKMVEFFRWLNDWDGDKSNSKCIYQVGYWFSETVEGNRCKAKPYKCDTIRAKSWCIKEDCPIYQFQKERGKIDRIQSEKA